MKDENFNYRHELKYLVSNFQIKIIQARIKNLMPLDSHGAYNVRSLYFDDYFHTCYYENENGYDHREKFRIRIYNALSDFINLELKRKDYGKTSKQSCVLNLEQAKILIDSQQPVIEKNEQNSEVLKRLCVAMASRLMRPSVIVDYERAPYIYKNGNVRITFDSNISSSRAFKKFFEKNIPKRPILPFGINLLEVKFDEYLPDVIYRSLQLSTLQQIAFSKFYLCKKYYLF